MAIQGYKATALISETAGTGYETVGGSTVAPVDFNKAELDVTELGDVAVDKILGLFESSVSLSGFFVSGDAGQAILRNAWLSEDTIYYRVAIDGTDYAQLPVKVKSWKIDPELTGTIKFTAEIVSVGVGTFL